MKPQPFTEDAEDLYQNAPFGYLSMRADGLIVNINTTLLDWLGYERNEVVLQKSFRDLLGIGGKIYFETHMMPLLQMQGSFSEINIELKGKNPIKLPTLINAKRVVNQADSQPVYRFSVLNISQRKQYEAELMKARKDAEQNVQRLKQINQELEKFAYVASHDLQAPLYNIISLMNLLEEDGHFPPDSTGRTYYSLIMSNTQRMRQMIKDLLDYSKIDAGQKTFEEVSLNEVCDITLELIDGQVKENNAVFSIPNLPIISGDKFQLVRLFQNIFSNAIKYRSEADPIVKVNFEENEDETTVFITDNGIGFEQKFADQVFGFMQRLQTPDSIPGTGIGLSACKRILEIHGGKIWAESEPGKGSTFYFTLPVKEKTDL